MSRNVGASVLAKLKNISKERGVIMQAVLRRYAQERLLYRLSVSRFSSEYCVKGGVLLSIFNGGDLMRPTEDIDFDGNNPDGTLEQLADTIREILSVDVEDDGIRFDLSSLTTTRDNTGHTPGGQMVITCFVDSAKIDLRVDVGFGNVITPRPTKSTMPTLLSSMVPQPVVFTYPLESVLAEKGEAMLRYGLFNTRLKDYYDCWKLVTSNDFEGALMCKALRATIAHRNTPMQDAPIEGLSQEFVSEKQVAWKAFLKKINMTDPIPLRDVVAVLSDFYHPMLSAIARQEDFTQKWESLAGWNLAPAYGLK